MSDALASLAGQPAAASWLARLLRPANDNHEPDPPPALAMRPGLRRAAHRWSPAWPRPLAVAAAGSCGRRVAAA